MAKFTRMLPRRLRTGGRVLGRTPLLDVVGVAVLSAVLSAVWGALLGADLAAAKSEAEGQVMRFVSCAGWGACTFRLVTPDPALGDSLRVRLRGVGAPERSGMCSPEGDAARTIRAFVEGILARATRIELSRIERRPDGGVLASVRADGTDVVDILVHIGLGRQKPLPPDADWCD